MKSDDLESILSFERPIAPSPAFVKNVMTRIQSETKPCPQVPFPWIPLVLAALPLIVMVVLFNYADPVLRLSSFMIYSLSAWISSPEYPTLGNALLIAVTSLLGTLALLWISLHLTGANR